MNELEIKLTELFKEYERVVIHCSDFLEVQTMFDSLEEAGYTDTNGNDVFNECRFPYGMNTCFMLHACKQVEVCSKTYSFTKKDLLIDFKEIGESPKQLYCNTLINFNKHKWVKFYQDKNGNPNIEWDNNCFYAREEGLKDFERRVLSVYGEDKNSSVYRTYMLEDDKLRLATGLPARTIGNTFIIRNFNNLLKQNKNKIAQKACDILLKSQEYAEEDENEGYFDSKNIMWLVEAFKNVNNDVFKYLSGCNDNYYHYDLITINYLEKDFAIPVPVLARILEVKEKTLYECFVEHLNRDWEEFI